MWGPIRLGLFNIRAVAIAIQAALQDLFPVHILLSIANQIDYGKCKFIYNPTTILILGASCNVFIFQASEQNRWRSG